MFSNYFMKKVGWRLALSQTPKTGFFHNPAHLPTINSNFVSYVQYSVRQTPHLTGKKSEIILCIYVPILSLLRNHDTSTVVLCHPDIYKQSLSRGFCPERRRIPSLSSDQLSYSTEKISY